MTNARMLSICFLVLGLTVWAAAPGLAWTMGTAFTYQGRLIDANSAADALYDFEFKVYDANVAGTQKGSTIDVNECDVMDGYFTVSLDFGSGVFDGNDRWLEIGVRAGELADPNAYTVLSPRQKVMAVPYALYAENAGSLKRGLTWSEISERPDGLDDGDDVGITSEADPKIGSNSANYVPKWDGSALVSGIIYDNGSVGIGKTSPAYKLDVAGYIGGSGFYDTDDTRYFLNPTASAISGTFLSKVGIGTFNPGAMLEVNGQVKITGGSPGAGRVLTSDAYGLATWQSPGGGSGDITAVRAGTGLTGGGEAGDVTVAFSTSWGDERYVNTSGDSFMGSAEGGPLLSVENRGTADYSRGIHGKANWALYGIGVGGVANNEFGVGVQGGSEGFLGVAVQGLAGGAGGIAVQGSASNNHPETQNIGGDFRAEGGLSLGVRAFGNSCNFLAIGPGLPIGVPASKRWKKDVQSMSGALDKVMNLRGVYFNWDAKQGGHHDVGMIAEEVGRVVPEAVAYEKNGVDAMAMDYGKLTPILVEAIKALKTEVDGLEQQNKTLEARLVQIEKIIDKQGLELGGNQR